MRVSHPREPASKPPKALKEKDSHPSESAINPPQSDPSQATPTQGAEAKAKVRAQSTSPRRLSDRPKRRRLSFQSEDSDESGGTLVASELSTEEDQSSEQSDAAVVSASDFRDFSGFNQ